MSPGNWIDRVTMPLAPRWTLKRQLARIAAELYARHYEAAAAGRRTQGWKRGTSDANAANSSGLAGLRQIARDVERNNGWGVSIVRGLANRVVGWGIVPDTEGMPVSSTALWEDWWNTTACDADGRTTGAGLTKLVMRTIVRDGEALVRRRWRTMRDVQSGLPIPLQLQVLEPDFLDPMRDGITTATGGRIIQGVEFDAIGRRVAYWLLPEHPGSAFVGARTGGASVRIPASEVLHVFPGVRAGQARGPSLLAAAIVPLKDLDDYEDAALVKQKIAACLAVITSDLDGTAPALGPSKPTSTPGEPEVDQLAPGIIHNAPPGRSIQVVEPPSVSEHGPYTQSVLRKIAAGVPATGYEDLTGDYSQVSFSSARMARLRAWDDVEDLRWLMLVPQFCDPVWRWFVEAAMIVEDLSDAAPRVEWTAPPMPMIEPDKEGLAYQRNVRIGAMTWPEMVRERGYNPTRQLREIRDWNQKLDEAGVVLDCDPRKTTQQGNPRESSKGRASAPSAPAAGNGNGARHR